MTRRSSRRCSSWQVSGISPGGGGPAACSPAARTTSRAWGSIASSVQRRQRSQQRTWCSSRPARPLPAWKLSSTVHRRPATATSWISRTGGRRVAAVEGQLPGVSRATDQQPPAPRPAVIGIGIGPSRSGQLEPGPVVVPLALRARSGREPQPGPPWQGGGEDVGAERPGGRRQAPVAGDGQHDCRCTPTVRLPFFTSPVSSMTSTAPASPRCSTT
jgi:hypothetical protein